MIVLLSPVPMGYHGSIERDVEQTGKSGLPPGDAKLNPDSLRGARQQRDGTTCAKSGRGG